MSGVIGVYSVGGENIARDLFYGLAGVQHRGEEGCGISLNLGSNGFFTPFPEEQLVYYFFRDLRRDIKTLGSHMGIGHTLYESSGALQPVEQAGENHRISMAMDGFLLGFHGKNDAIMRTYFSNRLDEAIEEGKTGPDTFFSSGKQLMKRFSGKGSYCVVALVDNNDGQFLVACRDPKGLKPLTLGQKGDTYIIASETVGLDAAEAEFIKDIEPGEMIVVSKKYGLQSKMLREEPHAHCSFEWVYYGHPASIIEGRGVYAARKQLGAALARRYGMDDLSKIFASPDSGRGVAIGCQQELTRMRMESLLEKAMEMDDADTIKALLNDDLMDAFVPFEEGIIKNSGAKRTFQVEDARQRKIAARVKFSMVRDEVRGEMIGVGDDSIVKGTVFRDGTVYKANEAGVEGVTGIISCPPLSFPCVKDPEGKTFIAQGLEGSIEEIGQQVADKLGMKQVCYNTIKDLEDAINHPGLCMACFDGNYPVERKFLGNGRKRD